MYCRTFVIDEKTKVKHIRKAACDFWGFVPEKHSLYFFKHGKMREATEDEYEEKVSKSK